MKNEYRCMICGGALEDDGFVGTIGDISVSFCRKHAGQCVGKCDTCAYRVKCHGR